MQFNLEFKVIFVIYAIWMIFIVTSTYESYSEKLLVIGFYAFIVAISLYSLATSESKEKVTWAKLIKKYLIIILIIIMISFVTVITKFTLKDMTKDPVFTPFVMLAFSLIIFAGGLWMVFRPISMAKRAQNGLAKDEEYIKKHSFWGEFQKMSWEYGGHKDRFIELTDPKKVRSWGIFITICSLIGIVVSLMMLAEG
jgi:glucan phosphoethanolaminetransferase (alkaline phosphatase superfamily)